MSFGELVQSWVVAANGQRIATGLSVAEATSRARDLLGSMSADVLGDRPESIDILHAMCRCLENGEFDLGTLEFVYGLVERREWVEDEFCEQDELLARLAYIAWNDCRRSADRLAMKGWQARCVASVRKQEIACNFLALPFSTRSAGLNARFLVERPVLLAACVALEKSRNTQPVLALREATLTYRWLLARLRASDAPEEMSYFAGELAYSAAGCCRQLGYFREHDYWLEVARAHFSDTHNPEPMLTRLEWSRLVAVYDRHRGDEILDQIPAVTATFRRYGMEVDEIRSIFLEANVLKAVGRGFEALQRFELVESAAAIADDPLLHGLSLVALGELAALSGEPQRGFQLLKVAMPFIQKAGAPLGFGALHSVTAEVLRNEGELEAASREYGEAVTVYETAKMSFQEAYLRLLRSDTLLALGREDEAVSELTAALPVIVREGASLDSVAAIALLKESLRRKKVDPRAVAKLRESFAAMRRNT